MHYIMSYFRTEAEALYLAMSNNGLTWIPLNQNEPILYGAINTRTMRDPFIFRAQDGVFHLFCSDGWTSKYIIHSFSNDLLNWSQQEALPVMVDIPGARNSWAPECFYDHDEQCYRIIWASTVGLDAPADLWDHRIWSATTLNFIDYTPAELFFDPGYNVIDATVAYHNGMYLMAFKDERGENRIGTDHKAIRVCTSKSGRGPFTDISGLVTPAPVEGPTLFRCGDRWMMLYDHFMENHFGGSVSDDGMSWRVITDRFQFPDGLRHGSVFTVDDSIVQGVKQISSRTG